MQWVHGIEYVPNEAVGTAYKKWTGEKYLGKIVSAQLFEVKGAILLAEHPPRNNDSGPKKRSRLILPKFQP